MARTSLKLAAEADDKIPPERTPARQKLADLLAAIAARREESIVAANELAKADQAFFAASDVLEEAEEQLKRSMPRSSDFTPMLAPRGAFWGSVEENEEVLRRAAEREAEPPVPIAEARAALARAQDDVDSATRLRQHWRGRLRFLSDNAVGDSSSITNAIRAVVRSDPALIALAEECRRLATRSAAAIMAFEVATGGDVIQSGSPFYGCTRPTNAKDSVEAFSDWSVSRAWREALEHLATDPDAPLPA